MLQRLSNRLVGGLRTLLRRGALLGLTFAISVVFALSPFTTNQASALSLGGDSSCAISTVGWVICPTMRSIARLADYGFTYINKSSLSLNYKILDTKNGTYKTWEIVRNVANGLFVVGFLVIIYNYLIGRTGGPYNLKRLLPRLIIIAALVNVSYYLGVVLIDVSNILGDAIWTILQNIYGKGSGVMPLGGSANPLNSENLTKITAAVMGNTAQVWALMPLVAAVIISIAVISAAAVILVIMRSAVIATLLLASPLLFVFYLLPNMERFSAQSMRLFIQLLMLYPIMALLLGTGQIISATVGSGWDGPSMVYFGGSGSVVSDLVAAATAVVPLLAVWFVFKNMSSIMNAAGTRLSASIAGRRGEAKDSIKARVTGNATAGASNNKNTGGLLGSLNRRQAYSRKRRHASLGNSSLPSNIHASSSPGGAGGDGGLGGAGGLGGSGGLGGDGGLAETMDAGTSIQNTTINNAAKTGDMMAQITGQQEAKIEAEATGGSVDTGELAKALSTSEVQTQEKEKKKQVTAKDIFNSLNKDRGHSSKDKDRKFSSGPAPAGGGGGNDTASGSSMPSAPAASYNAPQMAQNSNIVSGGSAPQQPTQIVAVPVAVDAATLLGQSHPPDNVSQPPISGTEEKAKARAQKYLFDSEKELSDARDAEDILGRKHDTPTEQPHIPSNRDDSTDKDSER